MSMVRSVSSVMILFGVAASHVGGQVLAGPQGPVEFIGLERWSAPELLEAIQRIDPDQPLHACAITMKSQMAPIHLSSLWYCASWPPQRLGQRSEGKSSAKRQTSFWPTLGPNTS